MTTKDQSLIKKLNIKLRETPFPNFSKNNNSLNIWIEELIEIDSYLAGLASVGEKVPKRDLPNLEKLEKALECIHVESDTDQRRLKLCVAYLAILKNIIEALSLTKARNQT